LNYSFSFLIFVFLIFISTGCASRNPNFPTQAGSGHLSVPSSSDPGKLTDPSPETPPQTPPTTNPGVPPVTPVPPVPPAPPVVSQGLHIQIFSGDGQFVTPLVGATDPLTVLVTDDSGHAVPGVPVSWASSEKYPLGLGQAPADIGWTTTDQNGLASARVVMSPGSPSLASSTVEYTLVTASLANGAQTIFHTVGYGTTASGTPSLIIWYSGGFTAGSTLSLKAGVPGQPIKVTFENTGGTKIDFTKARVIVVFYSQDPNAPQFRCVEDDGNHKGTVFIQSDGYATCTPIFDRAGSGVFSLRIGGAPHASASSTATSSFEYRDLAFNISP
jgi:hypothetical protein